MKKKDWYENWFSSAYYSILYSNRDDAEAERFVEKLIEHLHPPAGAKMLDIACGEGRHSLQLAEHGFEVTGIDLSYPSIKTAKQHECVRLHFYVHDMRFPFYINYFDYAFNFFTSFGYFDKDRDNIMAARSFAAALRKGGLLVVDYLNIEYIKKHLVAEHTVEKEGIVFHIKKKIENKRIIKDISFTDNCTEHHYAERVAAFTLSDFISIFNKADMTLVKTFGSYDLDDYDPDTSKRLIMIFKK